MSWTVYTPALLDALLGPNELAAVAAHLQIDARADILQRVISKVRGYCAALGALGEAGSVPPECEDALCSLYRYAVIAALPISSLMTEVRREEKMSAESFLKLIGEGKVGITRPDPETTGPDDLTGTGPVTPSSNEITRRRDRTGLDGS